MFRPGSSVAGDFSRVNHRGKFDTCPVCRCPGFAASSEILLPRRMETPNPNPEAQVSGEHRCIAPLPVQLRDALSPWRKTAVRNVRDNNAARVAGPGRICFAPLAHRVSPPQLLLPCHSRGVERPPAFLSIQGSFGSHPAPRRREFSPHSMNGEAHSHLGRIQNAGRKLNRAARRRDAECCEGPTENC